MKISVETKNHQCVCCAKDITAGGHLYLLDLVGCEVACPICCDCYHPLLEAEGKEQARIEMAIVKRILDRCLLRELELAGKI